MERKEDKEVAGKKEDIGWSIKKCFIEVKVEIENSKSCVPAVKLSLTLIKTSHPLPHWIELGRACI